MWIQKYFPNWLTKEGRGWQGLLKHFVIMKFLRRDMKAFHRCEISPANRGISEKNSLLCFLSLIQVVAIVYCLKEIAVNLVEIINFFKIIVHLGIGY